MAGSMIVVVVCALVALASANNYGNDGVAYASTYSAPVTYAAPVAQTYSSPMYSGFSSYGYPSQGYSTGSLYGGSYGSSYGSGLGVYSGYGGSSSGYTGYGKHNVGTGSTTIVRTPYAVPVGFPTGGQFAAGAALGAGAANNGGLFGGGQDNNILLFGLFALALLLAIRNNNTTG